MIPIHRKLWSAAATLALLPFSSALFVFLTEGEIPLSLWEVIAFPLLIFYYQGFLTGFVIDLILIVSTYGAVRIALGLWRAEKLTRFTAEPRPVLVTVLAGFEFLAGTSLACLFLDVPAASALALAVTWTIAFGLWRMQAWAWWLAIGVHSLSMVLALIAYTVAIVAMVGELGRPPGHMEFFPPEAVVVALSGVIIIFELIAALPVWVLVLPETRRAFRAAALWSSRWMAHGDRAQEP